MNELDERLRAALKDADAELLEKYAEPSLPQQILDSFRGRHSWLVVLVFVYILAFLGLAVWCGFRFFEAESLRATVGWAAGFCLSMMTIGLLKIWYWMELNKTVLTREMKRLELQIARLVEGMKDRQG